MRIWLFNFLLIGLVALIGQGVFGLVASLSEQPEPYQIEMAQAQAPAEIAVQVPAMAEPATVKETVADVSTIPEVVVEPVSLQETAVLDVAELQAMEPEGIVSLTERAKAGNIRAMQELASRYYRGDDLIFQDFAQSYAWFKKLANMQAIDKSVANEATAMVGLMHLFGRGAEQSVQKALLPLRESAANGAYLAAYYLSNMYATGRGVEQDPVKAYLYMEWASHHVRKAIEAPIEGELRIVTLFGSNVQAVSADIQRRKAMLKTALSSEQLAQINAMLRQRQTSNAANVAIKQPSS